MVIRKSMVRTKKKINTILKLMEAKKPLSLNINKKYMLGSKQRVKGYKPLILKDFLTDNPVLAERMSKARLFNRQTAGIPLDKSKARKMISSGPMIMGEEVKLNIINRRIQQ